MDEKMSLCVVTGEQCSCQPDEGIECPGVARLHEENARMETELAEAQRDKDLAEFHAREMNEACGKLEIERDEAISRAQSAEVALAELREGFDCIFSVAEAWCNAVDEDSSWDGWDRHFKEMKWEVLPALSSLLPTSTDNGGEDD